MNPGSCDDVLTATRISKQKPAHGGLKQPARRNQIEDGGRISFQFLAVTFFFFFFSLLMTHFCVLLQERHRARRGGRDNFRQTGRKTEDRQTGGGKSDSENDRQLLLVNTFVFGITWQKNTLIRALSVHSTVKLSVCVCVCD